LLYRFDGFVLDTDRRELRRGESSIAVEPQVFDVLAFLIQARERVVSRDDLLAAVWQGRIVSEATLSSRVNSARAAIGDSGREQRLIRTLPRKGLRFVGAVREEADPSDAPLAEAVPGSAGPRLAEPEGPSIAVLPFTNMSGDPEQEYFSDGVVEEIITALSQMRWLFVIARNSSFAYKGESPDIRRVGRELGVRYVLEGSVRKATNRLRITSQLIDGSTGAHLWAGRFEGGLEDVFELQDGVTSSVIGAIAPKLEQAEIRRAKRKPTESLDAYDLYLRGMANVYRWTKEGVGDALRLFSAAIDRDPDFATAYGMAAWCYFWRMANGWMTDRVEEVAEATRLAGKAAALGQDDAVALSFGGIACGAAGGDMEGGLALIDQALVLNPNLAAAWSASGTLRTNLGESALAIEHLGRAMRLSPLDPLTFFMRTFAAFAHFLAGRHDEAWPLAEAACREQPHYLTALRVAAASNAAAGRLGEAQRYVARALQLDPGLRLSTLADRVSTLRADVFARYVDALRKAGLPE
jgi:TolB-like protein/tetratricopeptide (TPR) repeat protein